jgi:peroxin-12
VLPYLKSKLHSIYNKEREARIQATLWGDENESYDFEQDSLVSTSTLDARASVTTRITKRFQKIVGFCYPLLHAGTEGMCMKFRFLRLWIICILICLHLSLSQFKS